jgi:hypothetical protein
MLRRATVPLLIALSILALPSPASAASSWDPDDVRGPFDLRWVGAAFTGDRELRITVSFYEGFRREALPPASRAAMNDPSQVHVWINSIIEGWFLRRPGGGITFFWGDTGSNMGHDPVHQLAPDILVVTLFNYCDPLDPNVNLRVASKWHGRPASMDRIAPVAVGMTPGCDPAT